MRAFEVWEIGWTLLGGEVVDGVSEYVIYFWCSENRGGGIVLSSKCTMYFVCGTGSVISGWYVWVTLCIKVLISLTW